MGGGRGGGGEAGGKVGYTHTNSPQLRGGLLSSRGANGKANSVAVITVARRMRGFGESGSGEYLRIVRTEDDKCGKFIRLAGR